MCHSTQGCPRNPMTLSWLVLLKPQGDFLIKSTGLHLLGIKNVILVHVPLRVISQKRSMACSFMAPLLSQNKIRHKIFYNQLSFNFVSEQVPLRGDKKIQASPTKQDLGTFKISDGHPHNFYIRVSQGLNLKPY